VSLLECVSCITNLFGADASCEACAAGDVLVCPTCLYELARAYQRCTSCADQLWASVVNALGLGGKLNMACTTTHSGGKLPGAGLCCTAVQQGQLVAPPAGTILPVYQPGQSAAVFAAGRAVAVSDVNQKCGTCMIVGSSSRKHQGRPVLKFIHGGAQCPSSTTGCCALQHQ
jgi:hypothetical protein